MYWLLQELMKKQAKTVLWPPAFSPSVHISWPLKNHEKSLTVYRTVSYYKTARIVTSSHHSPDPPQHSPHLTYILPSFCGIDASLATIPSFRSLEWPQAAVSKAFSLLERVPSWKGVPGEHVLDIVEQISSIPLPLPSIASPCSASQQPPSSHPG